MTINTETTKLSVKLWNSEKLSLNYNGDYDTNTFEAITDFEEMTGTSLSSTIEVNSLPELTSILDAVYNETDVLLSYKIL